VAFLYDDSLDRHGGIPQYLATLGEGLVRRGHRVSYLVGSSSIDRLGAGEVYSLARNVDVHFNGSCGTMPLLSRRRDIDEVLASRVFDVVHVQVPYSPFMAARVIRRLDASVAVVGTFHVNSELALPRIGARLLAAVTRRSLTRFDQMMCVSEVAARFARCWFGLAGTQVVPNMVDGAALRSMATMGRPPDVARPQLVFVGNLVPRKGLETLLGAMPAIAAVHPDVMLTVAGGGPLRPRFERWVADRSLNAHVRFAGTVSEAEKAALLGFADIACFPSRYGESFGIVLLEAIAAGAGVVVAGGNAAYAEVLHETPLALTNPNDAGDLAGTLLRFLADPKLRQRVAARQREIAARHDIEVVTDRVLSVYSAAMQRRSRSLHASLQPPNHSLVCQPS
jgi:phosphatidylinositol alpha-mannosyltransferase